MQRITLDALQRAVTERPDDPVALSQLGHAWLNRADATVALPHLERAAALGGAVQRRDLAEALIGLERWEDAAGEYQRLLASCSMPAGEQIGCWLRLGWVHLRLDPDAALHAFSRVVELAPDRPPGYTGLARLLLSTCDAAETVARLRDRAAGPAARSCIERAMATALAVHGRYAESAAYYEQISSRDAGDLDALLGLGDAALAARDVARAQHYFDLALARHSSNPRALLRQLHFRMRTRRVAAVRGLLRDESAQHLLSAVPVSCAAQAAPPWNGVASLQGRTIFVDGSTIGFGSAINFARFAWLLRQHGARVIVQCRPALQRLLASVPGIDEVVAPHDECSPFDLQSRLEDASFMLDWEWDALPLAPPYLHTQTMRRVPSRRLKVGIAWHTTALDRENPFTYRNLPLDVLRPLADRPDVHVFGLQPGGVDAPSWLGENLSAGREDFTETAAAVLAVDVVVAADSVIAHLAGALDKPCVLLLPSLPDSRWGIDAPVATEQCPWYPSVRMIRQDRPGDWTGCVRAVAQELTVRARSRADVER